MNNCANKHDDNQDLDLKKGDRVKYAGGPLDLLENVGTVLSDYVHGDGGNVVSVQWDGLHVQCVHRRFVLLADSTVIASKKEAIKHDDGKPQMTLIDSAWLFGVAKVLTYAATHKYEADNWRKGLGRRRLLDSALRHIFAYLSGEDNDQETGESHLYHASCCLMMASGLHETRPDLDDRYKG